MRTLICELEKIFSQRLFWILLVVTLGINTYGLIRSENSSADSKIYTDIAAEIECMTDTEKSDYLSGKLDGFFENGGYMSENAMQKYAVMTEYREHLQIITSYSDYLESIENSPERASSGPFAVDKNTFSYRSTLNMPSKYANLGDTTPRFDISKGVLMATDNPLSDGLIIFMIFVSVSCMIAYDRERKLMLLLQSTPNGRTVLCLYQSLALIIVSAFVFLIFYVQGLIFGYAYYGFGDLNRPLQSLVGFIGCVFNISVKEYLLLYFPICKITAFVLITLTFQLICTSAYDNLSIFGFSAAIIAAQYVLHIAMSETSKLSILHYINIICFTQTNYIFETYRDINLFGYPFSFAGTAICVALFGYIALILLCVKNYNSHKMVEFKKINIKLPILKRFGHIQFSRFGYALYNSMIIEKTAAVFMCFCFACVVMHLSFEKPYSTYDEYYQYYCNQLAGEINVETYDFIASEESRYDNLLSQLEQAQKNMELSRRESLEKQLEPKAAFDAVKAHIYELDSKLKSEAFVFYDTGIIRALDYSSTEQMILTLLTLAFLCFAISPLIAYHNVFDAQKIVYSTYSGKKSFLSRNIVLCLLYSLIISVLSYIPYILSIFREYGKFGYQSNVRNASGMIEFSFDTSVYQTIIVYIAIRFVILCLISVIMLYVSHRSKNVASAMLINMAVFALPILVALLVVA